LVYCFVRRRLQRHLLSRSYRRVVVCDRASSRLWLLS
jgi:hypothetical protein